jgi:hypothetical protein
MVSQHRARAVRGIVLVALAVGLAGCGSRHPLVPVHGKVTRGGGAWPGEGSITFLPSEAASGPQRPGFAVFGRDGAFKASSFKEGDGLLPGRYTVRITCDAPLKSEEDTSSESYVPANFTPPPLEVKADGPRPVRYDVDVPVKQKAGG